MDTHAAMTNQDEYFVSGGFPNFQCLADKWRQEEQEKKNKNKNNKNNHTPRDPPPPLALDKHIL